MQADLNAALKATVDSINPDPDYKLEVIGDTVHRHPLSDEAKNLMVEIDTPCFKVSAKPTEDTRYRYPVDIAYLIDQELGSGNTVDGRIMAEILFRLKDAGYELYNGGITKAPLYSTLFCDVIKDSIYRIELSHIVVYKQGKV